MTTHVVIVPGLGAVAYLRRLDTAVRERGARCTVLDLPGFGHAGPLTCPPTVHGIAAATADAVASLTDERVVLMGHSTGAQAALHAALAVQGRRPVAELVLAGPTVAPTQRSFARLLAVGPAAYRRDSPREAVVVPQYLRAGWDLVRMLRSGIVDRPEVAVTRLTSSLTVTAGRQDAFAPLWWQRLLVAQAVRSPHARQVTLPGSHNNPFTHPGELADLVLEEPGP